MKRPMCQACNQRVCAINYYRDEQPHYRSRCETCLRRRRGLKPRVPRWRSQGYEKKSVCDRCGFRSQYAAQMVVYHVDSKLTNTELKNLRTICRNCETAVSRSDLPWRRGDLEPDA